MPSRSDTRRSRLSRWLSQRHPEVIDTGVLAEIRELLSPVSATYLHDLVRKSGYPMSPDVEGVDTHSLDDLERTLLALAGLYAEGHTTMRATVIAAKDRLRWVMARSADPGKKRDYDEMILWMLTWLENPGAFSVWVGLRKKALADNSSWTV